MPRYQRHVFVCTNRRPGGHPKGCCAEKGSEMVRSALKSELAKRGLSGLIRANASGCLDACEFGVSVVIYPEGVWYGGVTTADVPEIVEQHLVNGRVVERLVIRDPRYTTAALTYPPIQLETGRAR